MTLDRGTYIEITPEPTPEEREAIMAALDLLETPEYAEPEWAEAVLQTVEANET